MRFAYNGNKGNKMFIIQRLYAGNKYLSNLGDKLYSSDINKALVCEKIAQVNLELCNYIYFLMKTLNWFYIIFI